jgi:hypothetical protein
MEEKRKIAAPKINQTAKEKVFARMYIANVANRLRDLNNPSDIDRKRWIWELIQNAKDTIAGDSNRTDINVRIEVDGNTVRFIHNGAPFTPEARFGLLYKYSDDKQNQESTGRFGTGFLTTHCLSKIVTIESDMYKDEEHSQLCGFKVTMFRDGMTEDELLEGLERMQESEEFYEQTFGRTTYTYNVNSDSEKAAIELGVKNFKENIAQTMLFCKELNKVELNYNGQLTTVQRKVEQEVAENLFLAEFVFSGEITDTRRFLYTHHEAHSDKLSERYRADRQIRLDVAVEIDKSNALITQEGKTSHFCVLPLVGIESQLNEPVLVNSPDFEPDRERQSLLLNGVDWNEEKKVITEVGINRLIYTLVFPLYERIVSYLSCNNYSKLYYLASGLKMPKKHDKLDAEWYLENVIKKYREILLKYPVAKAFNGTGLKKLSDCLLIKERNLNDETTLHSLIAYNYPEYLILENHEWTSLIWDEGLHIWNTVEFCKQIESKKEWSQIPLGDKPLAEWYNAFLLYIKGFNEHLMTEYALLPNMEGVLLKKDQDGFKQGENVTPFIIKLLSDLGDNIKQTLLHSDITVISLSAKYNSQSFSADVNNLVKSIIEDNTIKDEDKTVKLLPLISIVPNDIEKYKPEFITRRKGLFHICNSLRPDLKAVCSENNSLLSGAWENLDQWFVTHTLSYLHKLGSLSKLPNNLDAKWLNEALKALQVQPAILNNFRVLPNQNGNFMHQNQLFVDWGIPKELKDDIFNSIGLNYKNILLHNDIEAQSFSVLQARSISSFASDLKKIYRPYSDSENGYPFSYALFYRESYHPYSQEILDKIARYLVSILPLNKESDLGKNQEDLYKVSKVILGEELSYEAKDIYCDSTELWQYTNEYVANQIAERLSSIGSLASLCETLNCDENDAFQHLNTFFSFWKRTNIHICTTSIFPNQNGIFRKIAGSFFDKEKIDETLKDVIKCLVPEEDEYRNILWDTRCSVYPKEYKTAKDAFNLIDERVSELYDNPVNWRNEQYVNAVHMLIENWAEESGQFTEKNFPKTKPLADSIVLNVVWKKEKREMLMEFCSTYTEEQMKTIINNSAQVGDLTNKVKELEDENEILRRQLAELSKAPLTSSNNALEVDTVTADGCHKTINMALPQYADLSKDEMHAFLIDAKTAVKIYLEQKGYEFTQGICEDAWCNIYGVYKDGKEVPIVVHSYRSKCRGFSLNASDWEQLSKENSMLWVYTHEGPQCVPFYALPKDSNTISMTFSPENMQYKNRCIALAEILRYFKGLQFNFGTEIISNKEPEPFNNSDKELKLSIENSMRELHDLPPQSSNAPIIGADSESLL